MERISWRRRARAFVPALLLLFALAERMFSAAPRPTTEADTVLEAGEEGPCPAVPVGQKLIALTFDDGSCRSTTTYLLNDLSERGVKATFFLVGTQTENNGGAVCRMDEEGHQIDIHTFDHVEFANLSRTDFDAQVETTWALFRSTLGHNNFLLRPPHGVLGKSVKAWADCPIILWPIDPEDWRDRNTDRVVREVVARARNDGAILMHDIFPESVGAALQIVDQLHQQGYLFCMVDELFAARDLPLEVGGVYWNTYP